MRPTKTRPSYRFASYLLQLLFNRRAVLRCLPLLAFRALSPHMFGLLGLCVFEYQVFKTCLSRYSPDAIFSEPFLLLVSTILFTIFALAASSYVVFMNFTYHIAIDEARVQGVGIQLKLRDSLKIPLVRATFLLALLTHAILGLHEWLYWTSFDKMDWKKGWKAKLESYNMNWLNAVWISLAPCLGYLYSLHAACKGPSMQFLDIQTLLKDPCTLNNFMERFPKESQADTFWCRCCPRRPSRSRSCDVGGVELMARHRSDNASKSEAHASQTMPTLPHSDNAEEIESDDTFGAYQVLVSSRGLVCQRNFGPWIVILVLCSVIPILRSFGMLPSFQDHFAPKLRMQKVLGGKLVEGDEESGVNYWILPDQDVEYVILLLQPDPTRASKFLWQAPTGESQTQTPQWIGFESPKIFEYKIEPKQFGSPATFHMKGLMNKQIRFVVMSPIPTKLVLKDPPHDYLKHWRRHDTMMIDKADMAIGDQHGELAITLPLQADWTLLDLDHDVRDTYYGTSKRCTVKKTGARQREIFCPWKETEQWFPKCVGSCTLNISIKVSPKHECTEDLEQSFTLELNVLMPHEFVRRKLWGFHKAFRDAEELGDIPGMQRARQGRDGLLEQEYRKKSNQSRTGSCSDEQNFPLILTGRTGAGKSSLCRFITNSSKCEYSDSIESHTRGMIEVVARAFADSTQECLRVYDVPGFGDTSGAKFERDMWMKLQQDLISRKETLKQIVLVMRGSDKRMTKDRRDMTLAYRNRFGPQFYNHLTIFLNFLSKPTSSLEEERLERWKAEFTEELLKNEEKRWGKHWGKVKDVARKSMSNGVRVTAMNANPSILESEALTVPLSAPFVVDVKRFEEANLQELIYMVNNITKINTAWGLPLNSLCPPRGWGVVYSRKTTVRFRRVGKELHARVVIEGRNFMGSLDQLAIRPLEKKCTDPNPSDRVTLKSHFGYRYVGLMSFTLPLTYTTALKRGSVRPVRLCFAEFSPEPAFCQEAGIIPPQGRLQFSRRDVPNLIDAQCPPCTPGSDQHVRCEAKCEAGYKPIRFNSVSCENVSLHAALVESRTENAVGFLELQSHPELPKKMRPECEPQECPENSSGKNVPSGCRCNYGFVGKVKAITRHPYYSSNCRKSSQFLRHGRRVKIQLASGDFSGWYLDSRGRESETYERDWHSTWAVVSRYENEAPTWAVEVVDPENPIHFRFRKTGRYDDGWYLSVSGSLYRFASDDNHPVYVINSKVGPEDSVNTMWRLEKKASQILPADKINEDSRFMIVQNGGSLDDGRRLSIFVEDPFSRWAVAVPDGSIFRAQGVYWRFVPA